MHSPRYHRLLGLAPVLLFSGIDMWLLRFLITIVFTIDSLYSFPVHHFTPQSAAASNSSIGHDVVSLFCYLVLHVLIVSRIVYDGSEV